MDIEKASGTEGRRGLSAPAGFELESNPSEALLPFIIIMESVSKKTEKSTDSHSAAYPHGDFGTRGTLPSPYIKVSCLFKKYIYRCVQLSTTTLPDVVTNK